MPAENKSQARRQDESRAKAESQQKTRENRNFVQAYPQAWQRLRALMATKKTANAARLYSVLAEHLDKAGAVVATQEVLADILCVSTKTIQRQSQILEDVGALVRIQLAGGVYAYCLNPEEVWRAYDSDKEHASFHTRTLVPVGGKQGAWVKKRLNVLMRAAQGEQVNAGDGHADEAEPDAELGYDPETGEVFEEAGEVSDAA